MAAAKRGLLRTLVVAVITLAAAYQSYSFALLPNLRLTSPDAALARNPYDPVSISKRVHLRTNQEQKYAATADDAEAATQSLAGAPLSRMSVRIIGLQMVQSGETAKTAALMSLAHRISRRDPWVESWLLESAARRNDFAGAVRHFHAAMSVNPDLAPALNPLMVNIAADPRLRDNLRPYLARNALWTPSFVVVASQKAGTADLIDLLGPVSDKLGAKDYEPGITWAIFRIAATGRWDEAMKLAEGAWPDVDVRRFSQLEPGPDTTDARLGSLAWQMTAGDGVFAAPDMTGGFEISIDPLARSQIANRDIRMAGPGTYTLSQRVLFESGESDASLTWQGYCLGKDGNPAMQVLDQSIAPSATASTYRTAFTVATDCALISLRLIGRGSDGGEATALRITDLALDRN